MMNAGNRVVFDQDSTGRCCSYLEPKATDKRTAIHDNNGNFQFTIRIPKGQGEVDKVEEDQKSQKSGANEGSAGIVTQDRGFPRQGVLMADLFY